MRATCSITRAPILIKRSRMVANSHRPLSGKRGASATAAMNDDTLLPFELPSVGRKKLTIDFAGGNQSSDGGLLLLRAAERKLGVCRRLAEATANQVRLVLHTAAFWLMRGVRAAIPQANR